MRKRGALCSVHTGRIVHQDRVDNFPSSINQTVKPSFVVPPVSKMQVLIGIVLRSGGVCVRVNVRFVWGACVRGCCFACGCVLELVVCRVRFARVSCPRFRDL